MIFQGEILFFMKSNYFAFKGIERRLAAFEGPSVPLKALGRLQGHVKAHRRPGEPFKGRWGPTGPWQPLRQTTWKDFQGVQGKATGKARGPEQG